MLYFSVLLSSIITNAIAIISSDKVSYNKTTVKEQLDDLIIASSNGKDKIDEAITNKGFNVNNNSTYSEIVNVTIGILNSNKQLVRSFSPATGTNSLSQFIDVSDIEGEVYLYFSGSSTYNDNSATVGWNAQITQITLYK